MNEKAKQGDNFSRLSKYSLYLALIGTASYLLMFPAGIYYGFLCGVTGAAGGMLSHPWSEKKGIATAAIIVGIMNVTICLIAYHGLNSFYSSLRDPVLGPQVTAFVLNMLEQYGVSAETFSSLMRS